MSISTLRQLLADKLGNRDAERFDDDHLQNLLDKAYTDEGALEDATREGLQFHPALPSALVDKLLKAFAHSGMRLYQQCCQPPAFATRNDAITLQLLIVSTAERCILYSSSNEQTF